MTKKRNFVFGAALGLGLGLLFAPKKGSEMRSDLSKKINVLLKKAREIEISEVKEEFENKLMDIKASIEDLNREKILKIASKKAKEIQNAVEELLEYAVEKGTPVFAEATENVRDAAIKATKEVLEKLEKKQKSE